MVGQVQSMMTFDEWRARYDEMSDAEHVEFARACVRGWPNQLRVDLISLTRFFEECATRARYVLEVGGHDGVAASDTLSWNEGISHWLNVEIAPPECQDYVGRRYTLAPLDRFRWWRDGKQFGRDTLVCSHVLEHLRYDDVNELLSALPDVKWAYVECPIGEEPNNWAGYHGTHILEVGWRGLHDLFADHGFVPEKLTDEAYAYRRVDHDDPGA